MARQMFLEFNPIVSYREGYKIKQDKRKISVRAVRTLIAPRQGCGTRWIGVSARRATFGLAETLRHDRNLSGCARVQAGCAASCDTARPNRRAPKARRLPMKRRIGQAKRDHGAMMGEAPKLESFVFTPVNSVPCLNQLSGAGAPQSVWRCGSFKSHLIGSRSGSTV